MRGYDVGANPVAGFLPGNQTGAFAPTERPNIAIYAVSRYQLVSFLWKALFQYLSMARPCHPSYPIPAIPYSYPTLPPSCQAHWCSVLTACTESSITAAVTHPMHAPGARVKVMRHIHWGDPSPRRRAVVLDVPAEDVPARRPAGAPPSFNAPAQLQERALASHS